MWRWAADLAKERRARRAIGEILPPLLDNSRRRLGGIPESVWSDPYVIGFIMMLVTIIARIEAGAINENTLCHIQAKAWQDITGRSGDIGQELMLLSAANDHDFKMGCNNGADFGALLVSYSALSSHRTDWSNDIPEIHARRTDAPAIGQELYAAWEKSFDAWLSIIQPTISQNLM